MILRDGAKTYASGTMAAMKACLALAAIAALVPSAAHAELSAATTNAKRAYFVRTSGSHAPSPAPTSLDAVDGGGLGGSFHLNVEAGAAPVGRNGKTMPYAAVDVSGRAGSRPAVFARADPSVRPMPRAGR